MKFIFPLLCFLCGCNTAVYRHGVPNLVQVDPGVYRGGQPTIGGWAYLKSLGVTNVIKLNVESEGSDKEAKRIGLRVVYIPITTEQQIFGPVGPQLKIAVTNIVSGTYIHCRWGINRTGTLVMIYRHQQGWTKNQCLNEANSLGWRNTLPALKHYWRSIK